MKYQLSISKNNILTFLLIIFYAFNIQILAAQNENNIWYFGNNAGLDFSSGLPVTINDNQIDNHWEGTTSVCHPTTGQLLFYSNGVSIWDRNHNIMPNGMDLQGSYTSTMILALPFINNPDRYYLFTTTGGGGPITYSIINMTLNNGLGDIEEKGKNTLLHPSSSEKIDATINSDSTGYWLLTHTSTSNRFMSYKIDKEGIGIPIVSKEGKSFNFSSFDQIGYTRFSNSGNKVASIVFGISVELFNFNKINGQLTITQVITGDELIYGLEFSPDDSKLYVVKQYGITSQFDLNAGNANAIQNSKTLLLDNGGTAQVGVDGKIYITNDGTSYLDVIHFPNEAGLACMPEANAIDLGAGVSRLGLPNTIPILINPDIPPCIDCNDIVNGTSIIDSCGICLEPNDPDFNQSCIDCLGTINGMATLDSCGICLDINDPNFNMSCMDCNALINGTAITDTCGVCLELTDPNFNQSCILEDCPFYFPNIFSPNSDNINDYFQVFTCEETKAKVISFSIFDRWGNLIYEKNDFSAGSDNNWWDGTSNGQNVVPSVYVFLFIVKTNNDRIVRHIGDITLIR